MGDAPMHLYDDKQSCHHIPSQMSKHTAPLPSKEKTHQHHRRRSNLATNDFAPCSPRRGLCAMTIRIARKHSRIGKRNGVRTACWFTLSRGMTVGETENHTVEQGRVCGSCGFPCAVLHVIFLVRLYYCWPTIV